MHLTESNPRATRRARRPQGGLSSVTSIANSNAQLERDGHLNCPAARRSRANQSRPAALAQAVAIGLLLFLAAVLAGCQPKLDPQRYGQILPAVPQLEGTDLPYPLPELDEPDGDSKDAEK
jgi:hypothetical protein